MPKAQKLLLLLTDLKRKDVNHPQMDDMLRQLKKALVRSTGRRIDDEWEEVEIFLEHVSGAGTIQ